MSDTAVFDPTVHICKCGFVLRDFCSLSTVNHSITINMYQNEITFEFLKKRTNKVIDVIGFTLCPDEAASLLPFLRWKDYERYRNLPKEWQWDYACGYRDGRSYTFWCMSESGQSLLQFDMTVISDNKHLPPYEILFSKIKEKYKNKKPLKRKKILW